VAEPVTDDAVERRDQGAEILRGAKYREPEHRACFDQHVPAENDGFHLERPRGEQVGGPLEAEAARRERREHRETQQADGASSASRVRSAEVDVSVRRSSILGCDSAEHLPGSAGP
jgi:hypothetical protein